MRIELECKQCGNRIYKAPSQIKAGEGKYCSRKCYHQSMKGTDLFTNDNRGRKARVRVEIDCLHCGLRFETVPSKIGERKYCSKTCHLLASEPKIKDLRYYRDSQAYKEWRLDIYKRDGFKCQACGQVGKDLRAHHIIPVSQSVEKMFQIDNGITLCETCHKQVHKNNKPKRKRGELLGYPKRAISSQAEVGILRKVQRLEAESRTDSNASTSAPAERHDIVRACR